MVRCISFGRLSACVNVKRDTSNWVLTGSNGRAQLSVLSLVGGSASRQVALGRSVKSALRRTVNFWKFSMSESQQRPKYEVIAFKADWFQAVWWLMKIPY